MEPEEEPTDTDSTPETPPTTSPSVRWLAVLAAVLIRLREQEERDRFAELSRTWYRKYG